VLTQESPTATRPYVTDGPVCCKLVAKRSRKTESENWELVMIDKALTSDGLLFSTPLDRCRYIGTSLRDRPQWLKKHAGRWRPIEDVLQEAASPGPPAESEIDLGAEPAGPNGQTSSRSVRDNGDDEDDVALVDTLAGDRSPPHEPTSLPTPVTATVENGTTKPELLARADATMSEATGPKAEITPPGPTRLKRGRSGGRQLKKQKLPAEISERGRKRSPARLRLILDSLADYPVKAHAANKAGIHRKTLDYWLKCSAAGHDGYDVDWRGITAKFHEHFISAMDEGGDQLLEAALRTALGYDEILTYQGRVVYKIDPHLSSLGREGPDAYLKDENGNPVPETIRKQDPKMIRWLLERLRPDTYGKKRKIDVTHQGGVLVVGGVVKTEKFEK
jgi:hypothetical protein